MEGIVKISRLRIQNFRTLKDLSLDFPSFYTAICGKNDSGKSNIIRALNTVFSAEDEYNIFNQQSRISVQSDYTKWKDAESEDKRTIVFEVFIEVDRDKDGGLYQFVTTYLGITKEEQILTISVTLTYELNKATPRIIVSLDNNFFDDIKAQEILKKLRSSDGYLIHNSTEAMFPIHIGRTSAAVGMMRDFTPDYDDILDSVKSLVTDRIKNSAETQQQELSRLLERLESKYRVSLAIPKFDLGYLPVNITLGDQKYEIPLNSWGSGTRNRTHILLTLFRARQISEANTSADKVTPVIVIEEPESFLHPSAQAEFGRVLQDLAEDFQVQVIVTSHSPYMLSKNNALSNILLERFSDNGNLRASIQIDTTGNKWMEPFGLALGINSIDFEPWKDLIFQDTRSILLVEGDIDREYFEMIRSEAHGEKRLKLEGEIFAYGGAGNLTNGVLLRFIKTDMIGYL